MTFEDNTPYMIMTQASMNELNARLAQKVRVNSEKKTLYNC